MAADLIMASVLGTRALSVLIIFTLKPVMFIVRNRIAIRTYSIKITMKSNYFPARGLVLRNEHCLSMNKTHCEKEMEVLLSLKNNNNIESSIMNHGNTSS